MVTAVRPPHTSSGDEAAHRSASIARAGAASATSACRIDRADRALARERLADDARHEARGRGVGTAGAHADRHQPDAPPAQESLARVVGHQLLADELLDPVAGLRVRQRAVHHHGRHRELGGPAEHRDRTRIDHQRAGAHRAAGREQRLRGVQVRPDTQVEVGLALPADRGGQVKDHVGAGQRLPPGLPGGHQPGQIALGHRDPRVGRQVRRRRGLVEERHPGQRPGPGARHIDRAARQQVPGQPGAQEPGPAGNHHVRHGVSVPARAVWNTVRS